MRTPVRYLADMNISPLTVRDLLAEGIDVVRVSTVLAANASDREILGKARAEGRTLITQDLDFSALLALSGESQPSLVTLRLLNTDPDLVTRRLRTVLPQIEESLSGGCAVTIEDHGVRIRRLPLRS